MINVEETVAMKSVLSLILQEPKSINGFYCPALLAELLLSQYFSKLEAVWGWSQVHLLSFGPREQEQIIKVLDSSGSVGIDGKLRYLPVLTFQVFRPPFSSALR
jgi:hypothetical protein